MSGKLEPVTYERALQQAWIRLGSMNIYEVATNSMSSIIGEDLKVQFMGEDYLVRTGIRKIECQKGDAVPFISVLILHYLTGCDPGQPTGRLITFREIPGGDVYYPAFKKRAIDRLADVLGNDTSLLLKAGNRMKAAPRPYGDASIGIDVFPKLPVTVVMWKGDEEIPGSVNILFDETAPDILPMEDLSVIGNMVSSRIRNIIARIEEERPPEVSRRG